MSGGHWGYMEEELTKRAEHAEIWKLIGAIEQTLDWGICCDTCVKCAGISVVRALKVYFDGGAHSTVQAIEELNSEVRVCRSCAIHSLRYGEKPKGWGQIIDRLGWGCDGEFIADSEIEIVRLPTTSTPTNN
jgi:hypothetical protein